jgi:hypothetical protein
MGPRSLIDGHSNLPAYAEIALLHPTQVEREGVWLATEGGVIRSDG